ncbi:hypothetical protein Poli38472_009387 [Pythium oligandrum]|uniref:Uncharacterized protein n=1 Tax=Pythium oligandrum TaxID=41045 RepID=A0A8K1FIP6_PYTOL|nr:hypothetical protein Poli38472_009387 [Pythium oligandrum]|eukprot:TMW65220.1 hypothetical protein Poli38472_009387 [Pythium oligandrum]
MAEASTASDLGIDDINVDIPDTDPCLSINSDSGLQYSGCAACLRTMGCMVNEVGKCVSLSGYNASLDFQKAEEQHLVLPPQDNSSVVGQHWHFPALTATYCGLADSVCRICRDWSFFVQDGRLDDTRFCVGENNCICIAACERDVIYVPSSDGAFPEASSSSTDNESSTDQILFLTLFGFVFIGAAIGAFCIVAHHNRKPDRQSLEDRRQMALYTRRRPRITATLGLQSLTLAGWTQHRQHELAKHSDLTKDTQSSFIHA